MDYENAASIESRAHSYSDLDDPEFCPSTDLNRNTITQDMVKELSSRKISSEFNVSAEELVEKGSYLVNSPSWLSYIGATSREKYSRNFLSRNDKIWELLSTEQRYLHMLTMIQSVYASAFPTTNKPGSPLEMGDLFPNISELINLHSALFRDLLSSHCSREDKVIDNLGECFCRFFTQKNLDSLVKFYGQLMFVQSSLSERTAELKKQPETAEILANCERDPRTNRRTVSDCYLIIVQRWTKVEPLISGIIADTVYSEDSTEISDLESARTSVQSLLFGAQQFMTDLVQLKQLHFFADNLAEDTGDGLQRSLLEWMRAPGAKVVNYDKILVESKRENEKDSYIELHGIALTDCFFLLRQDKRTNKFYLYTEAAMPSILLWANNFGYFRSSAKPLTFVILLQAPNPSLTSFRCVTNDEFARWQKVFDSGFSNYKKTNEDQLETMLTNIVENRKEVNQRRQNLKEVISKIRKLDADLQADWADRNMIFSTYFPSLTSDMPVGLPPTIRRTSSSNSSCLPSRGNSTASLRSKSDLISDSLHDASWSTQVNSASPSSQCQSNSKANTINIILTYFQQYVFSLSSSVINSQSAGLSRSASDKTDSRPSSNTFLQNFNYNNFSFSRQLSENITSSDPKRKGEWKLKKHGTHRKGPTPPPSVEDRTSFRSRKATSSRLLRDTPLTISVETYEPSQAMDEIDDVYYYLNAVNYLAKELFLNVADQTLECKRLESENASLRSELEIQAPIYEKISNMKLGSGDSIPASILAERESIRQAINKLAAERAEWTSRYQKEKASNEKEEQRLKQIREKLQRDCAQYEEDRQTLQKQRDQLEIQKMDLMRSRNPVRVESQPPQKKSHSPVCISPSSEKDGDRRRPFPVDDQVLNGVHNSSIGSRSRGPFKELIASRTNSATAINVHHNLPPVPSRSTEVSTSNLLSSTGLPTQLASKSKSKSRSLKKSFHLGS